MPPPPGEAGTRFRNPKSMAPSELFSKTVDGVLCPLCLSKNYTLIARREPQRGILQTVYLCGDCRSYFGDAREFDGAAGSGKT
jgi:hypothetical protein